MVSQSDRNMHGGSRHSSLESSCLPASYGKTNIFLMAVGPYSAHVIWDVDANEMASLTQKTSKRREELQPVIKLHDITANVSSETDSHSSFEVAIRLEDKKGYIVLPKAGRRYVAELGVHTEDGRFFSIAESNSSETPRDIPVQEQPLTHESAKNLPRIAQTDSIDRQHPAKDHATDEGSAGEAIPATVPSVNRVRFGMDTTNQYIAAIDVLNDPASTRSIFPNMALEPTFMGHGKASKGYSRLYMYARWIDLTELSEKKFIAGISSS